MSEFVVAKRNLNVERGGIRSRIAAGQLVRADLPIVRDLGDDAFYRQTTHTFRVELTEIAEDDGRQLGVRVRTVEVAGAPAPADEHEALREVERYWEGELGESLLSLWAERSAANGWVVRAELTKDVPAPITVVVESPSPRKAVAKRGKDGTIEVEYER